MRKATKRYFTERESQIVEMILLGNNTPGIAEQLHVSKRTIESHVNQMLANFCLPNRTALCFYYLLTHDEISPGLIDDFIKENPTPFYFLKKNQINNVLGYNESIKSAERLTT